MRVSLIFLLLSYLSLIINTVSQFPDRLSFLHIDLLPALLNWYALNEQTFKGSFFVLLVAAISSLFSVLPVWSFFTGYLIAFLIIRYICSNVLELSLLHIHLLTFFLSIEILVIEMIFTGTPELLWPFGMAQAFLNLLLSPFLFFIANLILNFKKETSTTNGE